MLPTQFESLLFIKLPAKGQLRDYPESYYELAETCGVSVEAIAESQGGHKTTTVPTTVWMSREVVENIVAVREGDDPSQSYIDLVTGESICVLAPSDELVRYVEDFILLEFNDDDDVPASEPVKKSKKSPVKKNEEPKN